MNYSVISKLTDADVSRMQKEFEAKKAAKKAKLESKNRAKLNR